MKGLKNISSNKISYLHLNRTCSKKTADIFNAMALA